MEVKTVMNLVGFDNYENLVKGIDKSKMVQVQVTVKGKNGTFTRKQWKRASDVSSSDTVISKPDDPSTKTPKKQDKPAGNSKQRLAQMLGSHSRDEVMDFAKKNGVQWVEHSHVGINWMRASIAIQKHIDSNGDAWKSFENGSQLQQSDTQKDGNSAQIDAKTDKVDKTSDTDKKTQKTAKKQSKPDKPTVDKDKSKELVEKLGKDETLEAMKAKGITWKESDHKGINWMRAMQALGKHLNDNPNGFDELVATADNLKTKKDLQDTQKKVQDLQDLVSQLQNPTAQQMTQTTAKVDILKGITTDTMSKYEKSHFGDAISKASPESLRNYRTLGMCAGDKESEEYLADLYQKYKSTILFGKSGAEVVDADPLRNKLQGVVNKQVVGVVKSSVKNARKRMSQFTAQQKLLEPWVDPNAPLSDEQKDYIKKKATGPSYGGGAYYPGDRRKECQTEQDCSHQLMHKVLDKFKLSKEYGQLAEEYDKLLTEFDQLTEANSIFQNVINGVGNGSTIESASDYERHVKSTIKSELDRYERILSDTNGMSPKIIQHYQQQVDKYKAAEQSLNGDNLVKAAEIRKQLFDPKFTDLNVNLYHHKMMAAQLSFQYEIKKDFVAEYPILSSANLDKLDKADEDSLTNLALYAGMFKPSLTKGGKSAKDALMDKYSERQALLDAYGSAQSRDPRTGGYRFFLRALGNQSCRQACTAHSYVSRSHTSTNQRVAAQFFQKQKQRHISRIIHTKEYHPASGCTYNGYGESRNCPVKGQQSAAQPSTNRISDRAKDNQRHGNSYQHSNQRHKDSPQIYWHMPLEELIYHRHKKYAQDNRENIGIIPNCLNLDAKEIQSFHPVNPTVQ